MSENLKNSPDFIVSNEVLFQKDTFTIEDILSKV